MKFKSFLIAALLLVCFVNAQAQKRSFDANRVAERQTQQLTQQLDLTEEQSAKVQAINLEYAKKEQEVRTATEVREELRPQLKGLKKEKEAALKTVLNDKQVEKWSAIQAERRGKRAEMKKRKMDKQPAELQDGKTKSGANRGVRQKPTPEQAATRRTEKLQKDLSLTAEQTAKVEAIYLKYAQQKMDARKNRSETVNMMKELYQAENDEINAVLTPEQVAKRDALKAERKAKKENMKMKRSMEMEQN